MTVSASSARADYTGNGSTTAFTVPFYFLDNSHLVVYRTVIATGAVTTLAITTDYTVTGAANPAGGTVTCVTAPTSAQRLSILRNVPLEQQTHYVANDPFPAASHEQALDKLTMMVQQIDEVVDRAVVVPTTMTGVSATLPTPTASNIIAWNAGATALTNLDPTSITTNVAAAAASATAAAASASSASTSATNAAASASAASTSATNAATSATNAASSASTASTAATTATTQASNASTSASNASTSETNAAASASAASTSATNAATSATNAASSATSAAASALTAAGYSNGDYGLVTDAVGTTSDYGTVP